MRFSGSVAGFISVTLLLLGLLPGCTHIQTERGLAPIWNQVESDAFQIGSTHQSDVMALLGPPSQIINGHRGDIFYYLHEKATGTGIILLLYNEVDLSTRYDRAIFFFDADGALLDYARSDSEQEEAETNGSS